MGGHAHAEAQALTSCFSAVASPLTTCWTGHVASAGQRKPSPPAPGRARPAGRLRRDVRAEGQQSRDQGTWHQSWGQGHGQPAAGTSVVLSAEWSQAHWTRPRASLPLPRWAASLPGGLGLPAWTGQGVSRCDGCPLHGSSPGAAPRGRAATVRHHCPLAVRPGLAPFSGPSSGWPRASTPGLGGPGSLHLPPGRRAGVNSSACSLPGAGRRRRSASCSGRRWEGAPLGTEQGGQAGKAAAWCPRAPSPAPGGSLLGLEAPPPI